MQFPGGLNDSLLSFLYFFFQCIAALTEASATVGFPWFLRRRVHHDDDVADLDELPKLRLFKLLNEIPSTNDEANLRRGNDT